MIRLKKLLFFLFIFSLSINITAQKGKSAWFNGKWRGTGFQLNNGGSWSIHFNANTKSKIYEIKYSSLECSGKWKLLSINDHLAQFQETITDGISKCVTGGVIIITKIDKKLITYSYFNSDGKLEAFSTLEKSNL